MNIVERKDIEYEFCKKIFAAEGHHTHEIIRDEHGTHRWKGNADVTHYIDNRVTLNDVTLLLRFMGYDRNSEVYRKLYRDMGVSLYLYWEVFYWEANNPNAKEYNGQIR